MIKYLIFSTIFFNSSKLIAQNDVANCVIKGKISIFDVKKTPYHFVDGNTTLYKITYRCIDTSKTDTTFFDFYTVGTISTFDYFFLEFDIVPDNYYKFVYDCMPASIKEIPQIPERNFYKVFQDKFIWREGKLAADQNQNNAIEGQLLSRGQKVDGSIWPFVAFIINDEIHIVESWENLSSKKKIRKK